MYRHLLLLLIFILSSCGVSKKEDKPVKDVFFYNACLMWDKKEFHKPKNTSQTLQDLSKSVAVMTKFSNLSYNSSTGSLEVKDINNSTVKNHYNTCEGDLFSKSLSIGSCTGFLIKDDMILTSGHCVKQDKFSLDDMCKNFDWTFSYENGQTQFKEDDVYRCKKIAMVRIDSSTAEDFAVIRLKRKVKNRTPLEVDFDLDRSKLTGRQFAIIGHPLGMEKTISKGHALIQSSHNKSDLHHMLNSFPASSGSPIIDIVTKKVVALHNKGGKNYLEKESTKKCFKVKDCTSQSVSKKCPMGIALDLKHIKKYIDIAKTNCSE